MVIEIKPDVFKDKAYYRDLKHLIELCIYDYRYDFLIDIHLIKDTDFFQNLKEFEKDEIRGFQLRSTTQKRKYTYKISENNEQDYSLKDAIKLLKSRFYIFLENSWNDAYFFDCLRKHFKKHCKKLNHHKKNLWIEYSMGAGSTIDKAIKTKLKMFEQLSKPNHKYLRCFVLLDSDKSYPSQPYKTELNKLIEFLKENEIPHHVLEKREMENYLPDVVYDEIEGNDEFIDSYKRLKNPEQKDFFDLENGFSKKKFEKLPKEIRSLYEGVKEDDHKVFRKGGLKFDGSFKNEFPKLFESHLVTKGNLLERCNHQHNRNELLDLLTQINELL